MLIHKRYHHFFMLWELFAECLTVLLEKYDVKNIGVHQTKRGDVVIRIKTSQPMLVERDLKKALRHLLVGR